MTRSSRYVLTFTLCLALAVGACATYGVVQILEQDGSVQKVQTKEWNGTRVWYRQYEPATDRWYAVEKDSATGAWQYTRQSRWDLAEDKKELGPAKKAASAPTAAAPRSGKAAASDEKPANAVEVLAKGATWVKVVVDGAPPREEYVNADDRVTFAFRETLALAVGEPELVSINYRGKTYKGELKPGQNLNFPPGF